MNLILCLCLIRLTLGLPQSFTSGAYSEGLVKREARADPRIGEERNSMAAQLDRRRKEEEARRKKQEQERREQQQKEQQKRLEEQRKKQQEQTREKIQEKKEEDEKKAQEAQAEQGGGTVNEELLQYITNDVLRQMYLGVSPDQAAKGATTYSMTPVTTGFKPTSTGSSALGTTGAGATNEAAPATTTTPNPTTPNPETSAHTPKVVGTPGRTEPLPESVHRIIDGVFENAGLGTQST